MIAPESRFCPGERQLAFPFCESALGYSLTPASQQYLDRRLFRLELVPQSRLASGQRESPLAKRSNLGPTDHQCALLPIPEWRTQQPRRIRRSRLLTYQGPNGEEHLLDLARTCARRKWHRLHGIPQS